MAFTSAPMLVAGNVISEAFVQNTKLGLDEVQAIRSGSEIGPDTPGPTVGTNPLVVDTLTLAAVAAAGRLHVWASETITKTVATDVFQLELMIAGTQICVAREGSAPGSTVASLAVQGAQAVAVAGTPTVDIRLTRISGTGTATASGGTWSSLQYIFVPAP